MAGGHFDGRLEAGPMSWATVSIASPLPFANYSTTRPRKLSSRLRPAGDNFQAAVSSSVFFGSLIQEAGGRSRILGSWSVAKRVGCSARAADNV